MGKSGLQNDCATSNDDLRHLSPFRKVVYAESY